jgi:hypothetical protein
MMVEHQLECGALIHVVKGRHESKCLAEVVKLTETGKSVYICFVGKTDLHLAGAGEFFKGVGHRRD